MRDNYQAEPSKREKKEGEISVIGWREQYIGLPEGG